MNNKFKAQVANYLGLYQSMPKHKRVPTKSKKELSISEKAVLVEAAESWERYKHSPHGSAQLKSMRTMDLPTAQATVNGILDNPEFENLMNKLESLDLPAGSFSMALYFELEVIIGIGVSLGVAVGIGDSKGLASSEFLSIGLLEGIAEEIIIGVQFGIWTSAPADLGGYSWSTEVELGLEVDVAAAIAYTAVGGILGATVAIGCGEGVGIIEGESYTFILGDQSGSGDGFIHAAYQERKNNFLIIESVTCEHPSNDGLGDENEVYFKFQADGGTSYYYPTYDYFSMKEGDTWNCGRSVWFDQNVLVQMYDDDGHHSDNDKVGNFSISLSQLTLNKSITFNSTKDYSHGFDNIEYTIKVKLIAVNVPPLQENIQ